MKTKTILFACILMLGVGTAAVEAKTTSLRPPPTIKLLPISENGMLRLLVVNSNKKVVKINFYEDNALITRDKVEPSAYEKGFLRMYDFNKLKPGNYTIEVVSAGVSTRYEIELKSDKKVWARYWDEFLKKDQLVALR